MLWSKTGNSAVVLSIDQESIEVGTTCRVKNRREALHVTERSRVEIRRWVFVFMWFVMFHGLLHHLFLELVKHVSSVIAREGAYSIEVSVSSHRRTLSLCFWEGKRFLCLPMLHCGRDVPPTKSYIDLVSRLLSAISGDAPIICCGGSNADFVKVLDKSPGRKAGVQYPFALAPVQFERLLHKPSFSVTGRSDMFSMLRAFLLRLNGLLDERWVQSTQYFRIVRIGNGAPWLL